MDKLSKKKNILVALIAMTLCFIWGNSLMPASFSGAISGEVKNVLSALLGDMGSHGLSGDMMLRKIAHASEFAVLGVFITLYMEEDRITKFFSLSFSGLGASFVDETIQLFVDGRSGQIKDVWIDLAGFGIGIAIICMYLQLVYSGRMRQLHHVKCPKP